MNLQHFFPGRGSSPPKNIFISYRVQDTAGETGRLVDALKERFDEKHIFIDIEKIEPGLAFSQVISRYLDSCDVMLAIIGPNWLGAPPAGTTPRVHQPQDWVRLEISTALKRNIRVIPVLVNGATMPAAEQLPEDLAPLLMRQACEVSNRRWKYDTDQLLDFLEKVIGIPARHRPGPLPTYAVPPLKKKSWLHRNLLWLLVLTALGAFIWVLEDKLRSFTMPDVLETQELNKDAGQEKARAGLGTTTPANTPDREEEQEKGSREDLRIKEPLTPTRQPEPKEEPALLQVAGTWADVYRNYLVISQNGSQISLKGYDMNTYPIGSGTGVIQNGQISFDFYYQTAYVHEYLICKVSPSPDGRYLNGTQTYRSTGITVPLSLVRVY